MPLFRRFDQSFCAGDFSPSGRAFCSLRALSSLPSMIPVKGSAQSQSTVAPEVSFLFFFPDDIFCPLFFGLK